ncbi:MAG TPA: ATP-binding protein [Vicinamibacterales bacterium]|nr:ATP-binding protein [Vicinamibacterales bacterium]
MRLSQFRESDYDQILRDHYQRKYAGKPIDLIVAVMGPSLEFLLRHGETIFPGIPIVFCGADASDLEGKTLRPNITGVLVKRLFAPTLDLALRLHPETRHVFVVGGVSPFDRRLQASVRHELRPYEDRVIITYLTGLEMEQTVQALATVPPHSVVLYVTLFADGAGRAFVPHDALSLIAGAAAAPVYVFVDQFLGRGAVGGHVYSLDKHGTHAAEIGLRILGGETPASIAVSELTTHADMFDARQLQRWNIDERRLPPRSIVLFRPASVLALYRPYIGAGLTLLVVQAALIVGLLVNRSQRRRARRSLAERLRFETLLSEVSAALLTHRTNEIDREIEHMLQRVGEEMDFDRAILSERTGGRPEARATHLWTRDGVAAAPRTFDADTYPWIATRLAAGEPIHVPQLDALPAQASVDRQSFERAGIRSLTVVPLVVEEMVVGALGFSSLRRERAWPPELVPRLQLLADVFANVLARKQADRALRESDERRRQAEQEVQRQREELAHALRVATLAELTTSLAHELKQPLTAVVLNAQVGRRLLETASGQELVEVLDDIRRDATRAADVIQRLRALLQKREPQHKPLDLNDVVGSVVTLVRHDLEHAHVSLRLTLHEALPLVRGDAVQLQQVILNLLLNAREALSTLQSGPRALDVATKPDGHGFVRVTVRDSGVGVPESELTRIFEPFVTTKAHGLGMGLAISRSIIESHGGRIWATANEDHGLTVHVQLPA